MNEYLNNSNNAQKGVLVIYDARKEKIEIKKITKLKLNPKLDKDPIIIELDPSSTSKKAKIETTKIQEKKINISYNAVPSLTYNNPNKNLTMETKNQDVDILIYTALNEELEYFI